MKANELMIGDWAIVHGPADQRFTRKLDMGDLSFFVEFEPIPLTPEILYKNGFELRRETVWRWISDDERTSIRIVLGAEHMDIIKNAYYEDEVEFSLPCPDVIHELQHALRLCGIDKEIVL